MIPLAPYLKNQASRFPYLKSAGSWDGEVGKVMHYISKGTVGEPTEFEGGRGERQRVNTYRPSCSATSYDSGVFP